MRRFVSLTLFLSLLILLTALPLQPVSAQGDASAILAEVNALRAANGLPTYEVDGGLMAEAQAHAEYMASIGSWTHSRADGSTPSSRGFSENVAMTTGFNTSYVVYTLWTDALHWSTMVGISSGYAGVGLAVSGGTYYYVLDVKYASGVGQMPANQPAPQGQGTAVVQPTRAVIIPVATVTPMPDGSVVHEVQAGQSLWSIAIAYGVTGADIIALNKLGANPILVVGQKLTIVPPPPPTATPTITNTPEPTKRPTRTPTLTPSPRPPTATPTATSTPTATPWLRVPDALEKSSSRHTIGIVMVAICGLGLAGLVFASWRGKKG